MNTLEKTLRYCGNPHLLGERRTNETVSIVFCFLVTKMSEPELLSTNLEKKHWFNQNIARLKCRTIEVSYCEI